MEEKNELIVGDISDLYKKSFIISDVNWIMNDIIKDDMKVDPARYIYGIDEGDTDGIIWFMALNEDNLSCYVAYDNNIVKIGCGYEE